MWVRSYCIFAQPDYVFNVGGLKSCESRLIPGSWPFFCSEVIKITLFDSERWFRAWFCFYTNLKLFFQDTTRARRESRFYLCFRLSNLGQKACL